MNAVRCGGLDASSLGKDLTVSRQRIWSARHEIDGWGGLRRILFGSRGFSSSGSEQTKVTPSSSLRHALFPFPRRHLFLGKNPSDPCLGSESRNARKDASIARGQLSASMTKNPGASSPTILPLVLRHRSSRFQRSHGRFSARFGPRRPSIVSPFVRHDRLRRWVHVHPVVLPLGRGLVFRARLPPSPLFFRPTSSRSLPLPFGILSSMRTFELAMRHGVLVRPPSLSVPRLDVWRLLSSTNCPGVR